MGQLLMTTGYNFERYRIVKYLGVISVTVNPYEYFKKARLEGIDRYQCAVNDEVKLLMQRAVDLGGNGMIGLRFQQFMDTSMSSRLFCSATVVLLEKEE